MSAVLCWLAGMVSAVILACRNGFSNAVLACRVCCALPHSSCLYYVLRLVRVANNRAAVDSNTCCWFKKVQL